MRPVPSVIALWLTALSVPAEASGSAAIEESMDTYFAGEKDAGWAFGGTGLAATGAGIALTLRDDGLYQGMSYPLFAVAALELAVGAVLLLRTDDQVADLKLLLESNPDLFRVEERTRVAELSFGFRVLKGVEVGLIAAGVSTAAIGLGEGNRTATGVGIGLAIQSAAVLVLDVFAERRAEEYSAALEGFEVSMVPNGTGVALAASW